MFLQYFFTRSLSLSLRYTGLLYRTSKPAKPKDFRKITGALVRVPAYIDIDYSKDYKEAVYPKYGWLQTLISQFRSGLVFQNCRIFLPFPCFPSAPSYMYVLLSREYNYNHIKLEYHTKLPDPGNTYCNAFITFQGCHGLVTLFIVTSSKRCENELKVDSK